MNPKTKRQCAITVRQNGQPQGSRYQAIFPAAKTWTEVHAESFKTAVEAVKAGKGQTVRKGAAK